VDFLNFSLNRLFSVAIFFGGGGGSFTPGISQLYLRKANHFPLNSLFSPLIVVYTKQREKNF
jgi:hypothetical protein